MLESKSKYNKKTYSRRSIIYPHLVGKEIQVHNGNSFRNVKINEDMVFHKLGEFVPT